MKYFYNFLKLCALPVIAMMVMGGGGNVVWQNGMYLRWYVNNDGKLSIEPLKRFAVEFQPTATKTKLDRGAVWKCPDTSNQYDRDTAAVLQNRVMDGEYKTYVYLMILKIYNCEREHQGVGEIFRDRPEKLEDFNLVHGAYVKLLSENGFSIEYPLPETVLSLLPKSPETLRNQNLKRELEKTCDLFKVKGSDKASLLECEALLKQ